MRELLVDFSFFELRGALVENGQAVDFLVEPLSPAPWRLRDIFWARVTKVLPELGGAIVELGPIQALLQTRFFPNCPVLWTQGKPTPVSDRWTYVSRNLKKGLELLVQLRKPPREDKGALVSSRISVDGLFLSFRPGSPEIRWPWQLGPDMRAKISQAVRTKLGEHDGFSAHIRSAFATETDLVAELARLREQWRRAFAAVVQAPAVGLVYRPADPLARIFLELGHPVLDRILVDGPEHAVEAVRRTWSALTNGRPVPIERHAKPAALFVHSNVEEQIENALKPEVGLPAGGSIRFEKTAGATVVDVNSSVASSPLSRAPHTSGSRGLSSLNSEATKVVARQLRLRAIPGSIVIDFANSRPAQAETRLASLVRDSCRDDPYVASVHGHRGCALVHVQREYRRLSLAEQFLVPCPQCGCPDRALDPSARVRQFLHRVLQELRIVPAPAKIVAEVPDEIFVYLRTQGRDLLDQLIAHAGCPVDLSPGTAPDPRLRIVVGTKGLPNPD
ncbi:MAG: ribonuclease [Candidatus Binatia bacterium]|nr:MAG: ribonuclease [Candidatus Binatia bacterium]